MHTTFQRFARIALFTAGTALAPLASATGILITFDPGDPIGGLAAGTTLSTQYTAWGATFASNAFAGPGGSTGPWASNTDMTIVSSSGTDVGSLGTPAVASGNVLRSFANYLNENGDPSFAVSFLAGGVSTFSATFVGVQNAAATQLFAYSGNLLLGSVAATGTGQVTLSFSSPAPITRVAITPGNYDDWVGVDNIAFNTIVPVPEPTGAALFVGGLLGLGAWRLRRSKA